MATFEAEHRANADRLLLYQANGRKGSVRLDRAVLDEFDRAASIDLFANNPEARIAYAGISAKHLQTFADSAEDTFFFWVTLMPRQFSVGEDEAAQFDVRKLQAWTHQVLRGLNYVGMVEAALFGNIGKIAPKWKRAVSWHVHLIAWGTTQARIDEIMKGINKKYQALIDGVPPAKAMLITKHQVTEKTIYMSKAPRDEYRVYPKRRTNIDLETGEITTSTTGRFKVKKQALRPIDMSRMCKVMAGKFLHKLAFAGGDGKAVLKAIRAEALTPLRQWESRARIRYSQSSNPPGHRIPNSSGKPASYRRPKTPGHRP